MFKNKLQEYTQKRRLELPAYRTTNEGFQHAPKFRSTVFVDGVHYTSKETFRRLKEAEQDAAKLAYECIISNAEQFEAKPLLSEDSKSCKLTLYEFANKQHLGMPTYKTRLSEGPLPIYAATVTLAGKSFTGDGGKSKKDAEQLAAQAALHSLLGSDSGAVLNQMLSLKRKCNKIQRVEYAGYNQKKPRTTTSAKGPDS